MRTRSGIWKLGISPMPIASVDTWGATWAASMFHYQTKFRIRKII